MFYDKSVYNLISVGQLLINAILQTNKTFVQTNGLFLCYNSKAWFFVYFLNMLRKVI